MSSAFLVLEFAEIEKHILLVHISTNEIADACLAGLVSNSKDTVEWKADYKCSSPFFTFNLQLKFIWIWPKVNKTQEKILLAERQNKLEKKRRKEVNEKMRISKALGWSQLDCYGNINMLENIFP